MQSCTVGTLGVVAQASNPQTRTRIIISPLERQIDRESEFTVSIQVVRGDDTVHWRHPIQIALHDNPGRTPLKGITQLETADGQVRFSGLKVLKTGRGYTIDAVSQGLSPRLSPPFQVTQK